MSVTSINNGNGTTTIRFEIIRDNALVADAMRTGAFYLYSHSSGHGVELPEGATEANLTNPQIAAIWDNYLTKTMREVVLAGRVITATEAAREQAEGEVNL